MTAQTPTASTVHHPFGKPSGPGLWHHKGMQLPAYIQNVAHALLRDGSAFDESDAIHKAVGIVEGWSKGKGPKGKKITPQVQAAAGKAIAEWESKRATTHTSEHETMDFANSHHTHDGKFAGNTVQRERLLKIFQQQHRLPVTGQVDEQTKELLQQIGKAVTDS